MSDPQYQVCKPITPALRRWRQEKQKFKVIVDSLVSWRPALDIWDPDSKRKGEGLCKVIEYLDTGPP